MNNPTRLPWACSALAMACKRIPSVGAGYVDDVTEAKVRAAKHIQDAEKSR